MDWGEQQKTLFGETKPEVEDDSDEGPKYIWLCKHCGDEADYAGQIWGVPARPCQRCGGFDGLIKKYRNTNRVNRSYG